MKSTRLLSLILLGLARFASAADAPPVAEAASAPEAAAPVEGPDMCFYTNPLPADLKYTVLKSKLKVSKATYGSVRQMLPELAAQIRAVRGDAVVNYSGGQHFGFWPWRMTHPILTGGAIKWSPGQPAPDCVATGGELMSKIIASGEAPARDKK